MSVEPIPEGYSSVTPYLFIRDAAGAIAFYKEAFDAVEMLRMSHEKGRVVHGEIRIGDSIVMLGEEAPEMGFSSPGTLKGATSSLHLYVEDVDAVFARALAAGAKELKPVENQFYGDRTGTLIDPFGHIWTVATRTENLSTEEVERRFKRRQPS